MSKFLLCHPNLYPSLLCHWEYSDPFYAINFNFPSPMCHCCLCPFNPTVTWPFEVPIRLCRCKPHLPIKISLHVTNRNKQSNQNQVSLKASQFHIGRKGSAHKMRWFFFPTASISNMRTRFGRWRAWFLKVRFGRASLESACCACFCILPSKGATL